MITKIDHIGIAVNNLEDALKLYTEVFGLKVKGIEIREGPKVKVAMISTGESNIELLETTDPEGPVGKYIARRGEGIHHLGLGVSDIQSMLEILKDKGIPLIDMEPRIGAGGAKVAFIHPKGTKVLIELVEH